jgi:ureidoglycolate lyase
MRHNPENLTAEAFSIFGDVIETISAVDKKIINEGNTIRFHDLAALSLTGKGGTPLVNIFRSKPLSLPMTLTMLERHPLSSQAFYPLSGNPYLVVVAPAGELKESEIRVFLAQADQGVNYHPGTWHHYSLALNETSDFLVIDRGSLAEDSDMENCDEVSLSQPVVIDLPG